MAVSLDGGYMDTFTVVGIFVVCCC